MPCSMGFFPNARIVFNLVDLYTVALLGPCDAVENKLKLSGNPDTKALTLAISLTC